MNNGVFDLETCSRPEFIDAYNTLEQELKYLREFNHELQERLQEYEGQETDINQEFEEQWEVYGRKGNKKTSLRRFKSLTVKKKRKLKAHLPEYVKSTPNKQYRKNFETYINQEVWEDEILKEEKRKVVRSHPSFQIEDPQEALKRQAKQQALRKKNKGINIKEKLGL